MAKIKKLKENGVTIYPATIPEALVDTKENGVTIYPATIPEALVDTNGFSMADFMDRLLEVLANGDREHLDLAFSDLQSSLGEGVSLDMYLAEVNDFIDKVNTFLNDADASDTTINRWKEIESFLAGITDNQPMEGDRVVPGGYYRYGDPHRIAGREPGFGQELYRLKGNKFGG